MNEKTLQILLIGVGVVVIAKVLASEPNCNRGCKTVLEHITQHVVGELISGALGA